MEDLKELSTLEDRVKVIGIKMDELGRYRPNFEITWIDKVFNFFSEIEKMYLIGIGVGCILTATVLFCFLYCVVKKFYFSKKKITGLEERFSHDNGPKV
jgi:hypothetical protein